MFRLTESGQPLDAVVLYTPQPRVICMQQDYETREGLVDREPGPQQLGVVREQKAPPTALPLSCCDQIQGHEYNQFHFPCFTSSNYDMS